MKKIQLPPAKVNTDQPEKKITPKIDEKKIQAVISKGGSTTKKSPTTQEDVFKNFNIKILESELETINELRAKRPKARGHKRMGISLHDWIVEAVQEKIESERKKYKVQS